MPNRGEGKPGLALKVTLPEAKWKKGKYKDVVLGLSECHDPELFKQIYKTWTDSESAFKKVKQTEEKRERGKLWAQARKIKGEVHAMAAARLQKILGGSASTENMSITVNSVRGPDWLPSRKTRSASAE